MREDRGVDADQFPTVVNERSTGVAGVDGRIGLNEVLVIFDAEIASSGCADDAHGNGFAHAERITNGEREIADLNLDRKSTRLNSSHGYISYAVFCLKKKKKN